MPQHDAREHVSLRALGTSKEVQKELVQSSGPWGGVEGKSRRLQIQSLVSSASFPLACLGWKQGI